MDKEKIKRTSLLYQTDSVEMHVSSQIIVEYENELYSYIRYSIDFKYESLIQDSRLNNFPALKIAVRKNNRWVLTRNSPMGARFKFAYYNCSANTVLELFKGTRLVNNQAIISNENIVDFDRLIIGMENDTVSDNTIEMISDTIKLSYSGKRETEQLSEYWINQLGTHPVNSDRSIEEYNQDQIKLFLAVHQAIIEYTSGTKESSISIRYDDLYLNDDLICKTHIIKYGYWDETNNTYVFRIERNGPYDIKSFSVYVTLADNEFILDFQSSENHFEYVDHISERLHSRLCSNRFNKDEKNVVLEELKSSCMERAVNHTVIDFECFSSFISQLSEEERDILKSIYK